LTFGCDLVTLLRDILIIHANIVIAYNSNDMVSLSYIYIVGVRCETRNGK